MNFKNLIFYQHYLIEYSRLSSGKRKQKASQEQKTVNQILYPEDFAEAMFGLFTKRDL